MTWRKVAYTPTDPSVRWRSCDVVQCSDRDAYRIEARGIGADRFIKGFHELCPTQEEALQACAEWAAELGLAEVGPGQWRDTEYPVRA